MADKEIFELEDKLVALQIQQKKDEAKLMELRARSAEKLAKRRLNAHEAKELADNSTTMLAQIYKVIRDEAEEGRVRIDWSTEYLSNKCRDRLVKELELDGYTVSIENHNLVIQW